MTNDYNLTAKNMRHIFISDIHGCYEEFKEILTLIKRQNYEKQRIILLGDLIGKGPNPTAVVSLARKMGFKSLIGNHELNYFTKLKMKNQAAVSFRRELGEENHLYLSKQYLFIYHKSFIALHGGIDTRSLVDISDQTKYQQQIKSLLKNTDAKTITTMRNIKDHPWHDYYKGEKPIIYGHWAQQGVHITANTICLDGGCVYGKRLLAYVLEEKKIMSVSAAKTYVHI